MEFSRLSHQGMRVLSVFFQDVDGQYCGADLMRSLAMESGTLYPLLLRFEKKAILVSSWEEESPSVLGRPRKRLYCLTAAGRAFVHKKLGEILP